MLAERLTLALNGSINVPLLSEDQEYQLLLPVIKQLVGHLPDNIQQALESGSAFVPDALINEWTGKLIGLAKQFLVTHFPRLAKYPHILEGMSQKLGLGIMNFAREGKSVPQRV